MLQGVGVHKLLCAPESLMRPAGGKPVLCRAVACRMKVAQLWPSTCADRVMCHAVLLE